MKRNRPISLLGQVKVKLEGAGNPSKALLELFRDGTLTKVREEVVSQLGPNDAPPSLREMLGPTLRKALDLRDGETAMGSGARAFFGTDPEDEYSPGWCEHGLPGEACPNCAHLEAEGVDRFVDSVMAETYQANVLRVCRDGHTFTAAAGEPGRCWCGQPPALVVVPDPAEDYQEDDQ